MLNELNFENIPEAVVIDVMKRVFDWLESGGTIYDDYVKR